MPKWLSKGRWSNRKEAMDVLAAFRKAYKEAGLPIKDIRIRKKRGKYILQQWWG